MRTVRAVIRHNQRASGVSAVVSFRWLAILVNDLAVPRAPLVAAAVPRRVPVVVAADRTVRAQLVGADRSGPRPVAVKAVRNDRANAAAGLEAIGMAVVVLDATIPVDLAGRVAMVIRIVVLVLGAATAEGAPAVDAQTLVSREAVMIREVATTVRRALVLMAGVPRAAGARPRRRRSVPVGPKPVLPPGVQ